MLQIRHQILTSQFLGCERKNLFGLHLVSKALVCHAAQDRISTKECGSSAKTKKPTIGYVSTAMRGGMKITTFMNWLSTKLLPVLAQWTMLVMDNLRVHHAKPVIDLIESHHCKPIFLPPYSPDLNPIEMAWSKVKSYGRRVRPKSAKALQMQFHQAIKKINETEFRSYLKASGFSIGHTHIKRLTL